MLAIWSARGHFLSAMPPASSHLNRWWRRPFGGGRGFTIVELLVVIAVIAVLMMLFIPVVEKVQRKAVESDGVSRQRQLFLGLTSYPADHNGLLPLPENGQVWIDELGQYLGRPEITPDRPLGGQASWPDIQDRYRKDPWVCPNLGFKTPGQSQTEFQRIAGGTLFGGVGYNDNPFLPEETAAPTEPCALARVELKAYRVVFGSAYDPSLAAEDKLAKNRFGTDRAVVTFFDGHIAVVSGTTFRNAVFDPGKLGSDPNP